MSEGRSINLGVERPEPVLPKELFRKRQARGKCGCAGLRLNGETQVDGGIQVQPTRECKDPAELESPCPVQLGQHQPAAQGELMQECRQ